MSARIIESGLIWVTWIHLSPLEIGEQRSVGVLCKLKLLEGIYLSGVEGKGIKNGL